MQLVETAFGRNSGIWARATGTWAWSGTARELFLLTSKPSSRYSAVTEKIS